MKTGSMRWAVVGLLFVGPLWARESPQVTAVLEVLGRDDQARVVEPGDVLCSGERFRLEVEVGERSFVWVVQGRQGKAKVIYPAPGSDALRLNAGRIYRLPEEAEFVLDERRGQEQLIVVASAQMMAPDEVVRKAAEVLRGAELAPKTGRQRACSAAVPQALQGQHAPDGDLGKYREIVLGQKQRQKKARDVAWVWIPIVHR